MPLSFSFWRMSHSISYPLQIVEKLVDIVIFLHKQIRNAFSEAGKWHYSIGILDVSNVYNNFPCPNTSPENVSCRNWLLRFWASSEQKARSLWSSILSEYYQSNSKYCKFFGTHAIPYLSVWCHFQYVDLVATYNTLLCYRNQLVLCSWVIRIY
jgi:hypothetical protein